MPRAVPLKWQEKYNNRQKFIEKRADHPYSEIIVQEELLVFYQEVIIHGPFWSQQKSAACVLGL